MGKRRKRKNQKYQEMLSITQPQQNYLPIKIDYARLQQRCAMEIEDFNDLPNAQVVPIEGKYRSWSSATKSYTYEDVGLSYIFIDNGGSVLAVGHRDTVLSDRQHFIKKSDGRVISSELDDRLGLYVILDLLPKLGLKYDILLTDGEESGMSTARDFTLPEGKSYNWIFEFDRRGEDTVMYCYHDTDTASLLRENGFVVDQGSYSDIASMEYLGVKGFNFGVGYHQEHSHSCYMVPQQTINQVRRFVRFFEKYKDTRLPHTKIVRSYQTTQYWDDYYDLRGSAKGKPCKYCGSYYCKNHDACRTVFPPLSTTATQAEYTYWQRVFSNAKCLSCEKIGMSCKCGGLVVCALCYTLVPSNELVRGACIECQEQYSNYNNWAYGYEMTYLEEYEDEGNADISRLHKSLHKLTDTEWQEIKDDDLIDNDDDGKDDWN